MSEEKIYYSEYSLIYLSPPLFLAMNLLKLYPNSLIYLLNLALLENLLIPTVFAQVYLKLLLELEVSWVSHPQTKDQSDCISPSIMLSKTI